jgi:hypothetical protein
MKWHCTLGLLLEWLGPAETERARPILTFWPKGEDRGFNPRPHHRRGPAGLFRLAGYDSPDKVVPGRNSGPRRTHGWR